ncbi:MAG: RagB/SusD family nutrient uptake outer membrane protein [Sphingobacterium sp.]
MNFKSKIILGFFTSGFILSMTACQKDFLDRYPQTSITPDVFFKSEEDLALYVNGLLNMDDRWSYTNDQSSDNAATTGAVTIKTMMTSKTEPTSETAAGDWKWERLRDINYFLENYQRANVSDEIKNHYAGLARYYRAKFYYGRIKQYSDVPWYGKTLNPSDDALRDAQSPR